MNMKMKSLFNDKTILITGGTGSLGRKLAEILLKTDQCKKIIIFSRDEFKQHDMNIHLNDTKNKLRFFLGDVRDLPRLERAFAGVDIVIHAAALKQVPAIEYNPMEAIKTNIIGTQNVINASINNGIKKTLFISTDKAVSPVNLYGATKLCAEKLILSANVYRRSEKSGIFSVVRYGNVIGSRGSFIEIINKQKNSGKITLTDERMTRFWITLDEAVDLVLDALYLMKRGEIFIPKLSSMRVLDLIKAMAPTCKIKVVGIRPGEKIHEVLLSEEESIRTKDIGKYYVISPQFWEDYIPQKGKPLPKDFVYSSDKVRFLSKEEMIKKI